MNQSPPALPSPSCATPEFAAPAFPAPRRAAEVFLESLQERVYGAVGLTADECRHREWMGEQTILPIRLKQKAQELSASEFASYRSAVFEALARDETLPRPTPFERPHQYSIVRDLTHAIESAATRLGIVLPFTPVVGTLPTRVLEPLMVRVPGGEEVVLVLDGNLLTFVHLLAKAVAHALPFEMLDADGVSADVPADGWQAQIDRDGTATQRFAELMLASVGGSAGTAPSYAPERRCEQMTAALCECMELFVLGREYGRLSNGEHLVAQTEERHAFGERFEALVWTPAQEHQADALGLALMLSAATENTESARLAYWSADLLLASLGVLERALVLSERPTGVPSLWLPPTVFDERRTRLRRWVHQLNGGEGAVAFATLMEPVVSTLADRFELLLHDLRHGPHAVH